jgi:hypothetical protein
MSKPANALFPKKPEAPPRIYAYSLNNRPGELKIGQTIRDVKTRVAEQTKTAGQHPTIHVNELAVRNNGTTFTDFEVRDRLKKKGYAPAELEWIKCSVDGVLTAVTELRLGLQLLGTHHQTFPMRPEQNIVDPIVKTNFQIF